MSEASTLSWPEAVSYVALLAFCACALLIFAHAWRHSNPPAPPQRLSDPAVWKYTKRRTVTRPAASVPQTRRRKK